MFQMKKKGKTRFTLEQFKQEIQMWESLCFPPTERNGLPSYDIESKEKQENNRMISNFI